jgi:ABC-2 type transport system permease protein
MKTFVNLLKNEFKRIFNNDVVMAIFFGAPLAYGLLFGYVYQKAKVTNIPIVVIDEDQTPLSDKIIDALNDTEALKIVKVAYDNTGIRDMMIKNANAAVIEIPKDFEKNIQQKRYPEINVDLDMSNILIANFASKNIQRVLQTIKAGIEIETLNKQGMPRQQAIKSFESFKTNYHKLYNPNSNYEYFMLPGLLGAIMQQVLFLGLALVFARDFEDGYFKQLLKVTKNPLYLIALKALPFILLAIIDWALLGFFLRWFQVDLHLYNFPMFLLISLLTFSAIMIGMLFSILIPNQLKATEFLMVISTPAFILSGFTWPVMAMPGWIQSISNWIPLTPFLNASKKIAFYGGQLRHITPEIKQLFLIGLVSFILIVISLKVKIALQSRKKMEK